MVIFRTVRQFLARWVFHIALLILTIVALISFYAEFEQPPSTALIRSIAVPANAVAEGKVLDELSQGYEYALLSAVVYPIAKNRISCDGKAVDLSGNWDLMTDAELPGLTDFNQFAGYRFSIWTEKRSVGGGPRRAVFAFAGTDAPEDFASNFRWFSNPFGKLRDDQYTQTRKVVEKYAPILNDRGYRLIATGHSLGGGLAQHAAYATDKLKTVFSFDASSVTGFYDFTARQRGERKQGVTIYRIYQRGEVLAYLRGIMSRIYPVVLANPAVVEVRYSFPSDSLNIVTRHKMNDLACNMRRIAEGRPAT